MDRGKAGIGRGAKSKIAQHPSDLFALGSKGSRTESSDAKRPGVIHSKPSSSSSTTGKQNMCISIQLTINKVYDVVFLIFIRIKFCR